MARAVIHSAFSLVLMATLLWGECLSCPKLFSTPRAKSCCKPTGCEKPKPPESRHGDCKSHPESAMTFVKADPAWAQPADPSALFGPIELSRSPARVDAAPHAPDFTRLAEYSPPGLYVLFSVFRI